MNQLENKNSKSFPKIAWLIWGLAAFFYFAQYVLRVVPSVIEADLREIFNISAGTSGLLGGFFYYPYIAMQVPIGALVDKFGARLLLGLAAAACAISAVLFVQANSLVTLFTSRFLLGLFSAAGFVCALKLARMWLPIYMFGLVVGFTQTLGMFGAGLGGPVSNINDAYGYPIIFNTLAVVFVVLSIMSFIYVRNAPTSNQKTSTSQPGLSKGFPLHVIKDKYTWINALYAGLIYAPTQVWGEYWGPTFLSSVYDMTITQGAWAKSMLFYGWVIGGPLAGIYSDKVGRRKVMIFSALICTGILAFIFLGPKVSPTVIFVLFFLFGLLNTGLVASYAASGELHDSASSGVCMAICNMFSIMFGALLIPICGAILDLVTSGTLGADGYPIYTRVEMLRSFSLIPLCSVLALVLAVMMKETYEVK